MNAIGGAVVLADVATYGFVPVGEVDIGIVAGEVAQGGIEISVSVTRGRIVVAIEGAKSGEDDLGIRTGEVDDFLEIVGATPVTHAAIGA